MVESMKNTLDRLLSMAVFFENDDDRLAINISGSHYEINASDLFNFPETTLGDTLKRARYLVPGTSDYFLPRHPTSFESILYYYISDGILIKPETVPTMVFYEEIRFYQLNDKLIKQFYNDYIAVNENKLTKHRQWWRKYLSQSFIHPPANYLNSLFTLLSAIFNGLSIYSLCLETLSVYRQSFPALWMITHPTKPINRTKGFECSDYSIRPYQYLPYFNSENSHLEIICVTWFYVELFMRTLAASSWLSLVHDPNFFLDIISIMPTIITQLLHRFYITRSVQDYWSSNGGTQLFDYLTCFKLVRLFRVTRHAKSLALFIKILYIHLKDLLMLTVLITFGVFYFGLTQFVLEQNHRDTEINNIGEALWHGFTVIITVGYSDLTEYQFPSYILAIIGVWYGAICMGIVLPSITQSYAIYHNFRYRRNVIQFRLN